MTGDKRFVFKFSGVVVREQELQVLRGGQVLTLEPRAFRTLLCLLRKPHQLLSKDEIQTAVWGETAVSDNSLTRAISVLRKVLDDDPHNPRFIETVSTIGYRFICAVETLEEPAEEKDRGESANRGSAAPDVESGATDGTAKKGKGRFRIWMTLGAIGSAAAVAFVFLYFSSPLPPPRITDSVQITRDGRIKHLVGTDGANLYLNLFNSYVYTPSQVPSAGGQITPLVIDLPNNKDPHFSMGLVQGGISPDGTRMLVRSPTEFDRPSDVWVVGTQGHPVRFLTKRSMALHGDAAWSPDGKQLVFSNNGDLFIIPSEGGNPHMLLSAANTGATNDPTDYLSWSPDGRRIRFTRTYENRIWEVSIDGSSLHKVLPGWDESHQACCGHWTPDGDFYLFQVGPRLGFGVANQQLRVLDERHRGLRSPIKQPVQLTTGPMVWDDSIPSGDGKSILAVGTTLLGELDRFDKQSNQLQPYLGGISAEYVAFSKDGKYVAYVSFPEGILWRCNPDGTGLTQLTSPPLHPLIIQWSPDGQQILFEASAPDGKNHFIYVVPSQGGVPTRLIPDDTDQSTPSWLPDGKRIVYSTVHPGNSAPGPLKINVLDLESHKITALPAGPETGWSPRVSPDGRYISFLGPYTADPMIFDFETQRYSVLQGLQPIKTLNFNLWSHDSKFLYFVLERGPGGASGVYRIPVAGGKAERVVDLKGFRHIGFYGLWMGLDPADAPMLLRDVGSQEIYALTLVRK
jgi:Tol biopolymer transport system component/DNA-binding winged helix-turn-helix (wHTH) protein